MTQSQLKLPGFQRPLLPYEGDTCPVPGCVGFYTRILLIGDHTSLYMEWHYCVTLEFDDNRHVSTYADVSNIYRVKMLTFAKTGAEGRGRSSMNMLNQTEPATFSILSCWAFFRDSFFLYLCCLQQALGFGP
jgi:hypothetical protein